MERDMANQDVARCREIKEDVDDEKRCKPMSGPSNTNGKLDNM